jgi:hypothetical protein
MGYVYRESCEHDLPLNMPEVLCDEVGGVANLSQNMAL